MKLEQASPEDRTEDESDTDLLCKCKKKQTSDLNFCLCKVTVGALKHHMIQNRI